MPPIRIAISANFTAEPLKDPLAHLLALLRIEASIEFAPFDQVFQTLLGQSSVFASNGRGVNVVLLEAAGWTPHDLQHFAEVLGQTRFRVPLLVATGPGTPAQPDIPGLNWITAASIAAEHPGLQILDPHTDREARIPYTAAYFAALALRLARDIRSRLPGLRQPKVIAVDCDNTLWRGVCGEDGPEGVVLDDGRRQLQQFLLRQREAGKLICLASKNNEEDVWETFRAHPEFPLRPEHCVAWRINWEPKSQNLESLAAELSLGADSFVLIDDDLRECGEVRADLPEALVLELPQESSEIGVWLGNLWIFDHGTVTEEDLKRNQYYSEISARSRMERQAASFEEFIARLELEITIEPLSAKTMARAAQLTERTNQMNLSTVRRSESDLLRLSNSGEIIGRAVHVKDRFGDYGMVGLLLLRPAAGELIIDTMLLSCRAIGRGVEHAMLREAAALAAEHNLPAVTIHFTPTRKNAPARSLLDSLPDAQATEGGFQISAAQLAKFEFTPSLHQSAAAAAESPQPERNQAAAQGDYAAIAALKGDPKRLLASMNQPSPGSLLPDGTTTEQTLARIWAGMLPVPTLSLDDDFFDLGGHSLLAVQLLTRIRETFNIELSLDLVYSGKLTIRHLAAIIENGGAIAPQESAGVTLSEEEYAALLAEVEQLSEEEVQTLLGGGH